MTREKIIKFFIVASNLNRRIVKAHYFSKLERHDDETNYKLFERFANECSSTLLCLMHRLGYCNARLENIIRRLVETRRENNAFYENDAGGHIADFLRQFENREQREGKLNLKSKLLIQSY